MSAIYAIFNGLSLSSEAVGLHAPEPDPPIPPPKEPPLPGPVPEREPPQPSEPPIGDPPPAPADAPPMH